MEERRNAALVRPAVIGMVLTSLAIQALFLFSSELFNNFTSYRYDAQGMSMALRLGLSFEPSVLVIFLVSFLLNLGIIAITLIPLFAFLRDGTRLDAARLATIRLPWRVIIIQGGVWLLGTTVFYASSSWVAPCGMTFSQGLFLKLSIGFMSSLYTCLVTNLLLVRLKGKLGIVDIRPGERDLFAKHKNLLVTAGSVLYVIAHFVHFSYYLSMDGRSPGFPAGTLAVWSSLFLAVTMGLAWLSFREHRIQVKFLAAKAQRLLDSSRADPEERVPLLSFNDIGEFSALFNKFLDKFGKLLEEASSSAKLLSSSVQDLSSTTKEISATTGMQASSVKEIISTMEGSNKISESIGRSVSEVAKISLKTKEYVESGTELVKQSLDKMFEIRKKNTDSITGIRALTDKIRAVWDIVDIINAIVEQTRIIAFNAALEASTAGEAGHSFKIVAAEIKRLADSTASSTAEIQARITEIQKAASNLIVVSEEGTERIRQGHELSDKLHSVFSEILSSADIAASSSESIEGAIARQLDASGRILQTMKEISEGIDSLAESQRDTSRTAEALEKAALSIRSQTGQFDGSGLAPAEGE